MLRLAANIIDALVFIPVGILFDIAYRTGNLGIILSFQVIAALLNASYATILHAKYGATLGKMATGLRVRKVDLSNIGWREAIWRSAVDYVFIFFTTVGTIITFVSNSKQDFAQGSTSGATHILQANQAIILVAVQVIFALWTWSEVIVLLFNDKRRALHDFIAGTVVVVKDSLPKVTQDLSKVGSA